LEILLTTPLPIDRVLTAQCSHTFWTFLWSALAIIIADFIVFSRNFTDVPVVLLGAAIFLFVDARALIWRSMLQAFGPARYPIGVLRVTVIVLLPPIILLALVLFSGRGISSHAANVLFFFWYLGCGIYDLVLIQRTRNLLRKKFRRLASEPVQAKARVSMLPKALQWLLLKEAEAKPAL
jgi:hypothetical protein